MNPQRLLVPTYVILGNMLLLSILTSCARPKDVANVDQVPSTPTSIPGVTELRLSEEGNGSVGDSDVLQAAISTSADAIMNGVNLQRAQEGLAPWLIEAELAEIAYERSVDMAVRGYLDHADPDDDRVPVESALIEHNYSGQAAELVLATEDSLQAVAHDALQAWFSDPNHEAVLLSPIFRYAGLGLMGDGSRWIVTLIAVEERP
jgi:uncharacterized protein YkwD